MWRRLLGCGVNYWGVASVLGCGVANWFVPLEAVADPHWFQCGSGFGSGSRSPVLMTKNWEKFTAAIKFMFFF
jgi:hypothetical protein